MGRWRGDEGVECQEAFRDSSEWFLFDVEKA